MAKRKNQLADRLNSNTKPGWRDIINTPQSASGDATDGVSQGQSASVQTGGNVSREAAPRYKRKTYLVAPDMIARIEAIADSERVGINELVRYLLDHALSEVESGEHTIPTTAGKRAISS